MSRPPGLFGPWSLGTAIQARPVAGTRGVSARRGCGAMLLPLALEQPASVDFGLQRLKQDLI